MASEVCYKVQVVTHDLQGASKGAPGGLASGLHWTYGSSPLTAHTCLYASFVGLQSLSSNLAISIGHPMYILVPMQHDHSTLWPDMHDTLRITSPKPSSYHPSQDAACPA